MSKVDLKAAVLSYDVREQGSSVELLLGNAERRAVALFVDRKGNLDRLRLFVAEVRVDSDHVIQRERSAVVFELAIFADFARGAVAV